MYFTFRHIYLLTFGHTFMWFIIPPSPLNGFSPWAWWRSLWLHLGALAQGCSQQRRTSQPRCKRLRNTRDLHRKQTFRIPGNFREYEPNRESRLCSDSARSRRPHGTKMDSKNNTETGMVLQHGFFRKQNPGGIHNVGIDAELVSIPKT